MIFKVDFIIAFNMEYFKPSNVDIEYVSCKEASEEYYNTYLKEVQMNDPPHFVSVIKNVHQNNLYDILNTRTYVSLLDTHDAIKLVCVEHGFIKPDSGFEYQSSNPKLNKITGNNCIPKLKESFNKLLGPSILNVVLHGYYFESKNEYIATNITLILRENISLGVILKSLNLIGMAGTVILNNMICIPLERCHLLKEYNIKTIPYRVFNSLMSAIDWYIGQPISNIKQSTFNITTIYNNNVNDKTTLKSPIKHSIAVATSFCLTPITPQIEIYEFDKFYEQMMVLFYPHTVIPLFLLRLLEWMKLNNSQDIL